jgi:glycerol-3-phosphate O-acyltransferase/dihydroxyacetone phosphate acyltransferase
MSSPAYIALKLFLQQVTGNYFRNIHVAGTENIPMEGPTILCCNHSNQFMDAMLLISRCPRPLSFCFAASSYNKPVIGYLAKKINVIPVYRAEDSKIQGKGKIIMTSDTDIQGFNTKFISEVKKNKNFKLGIHTLLIKKKYKLTVEKVIDEEHIKVRSDPKLYEIFKKEGKQNFYFIPKVDNSLMFRETTQKLKEGKAICIFPEGTSHDRTNLLQLKPGVAYIALEAMVNYGIKNIKLLSCGISYFNRDQFRSDLVLEFGVPFELPESFGNVFKANKKQAIDLVLK